MRFPRSFLLVALVVVWAGPGGIAQAQTPRGPLASRHSRVDALLAPWSGPETPGCVLAISQEGALDYLRGHGMANLEHGLPITPESVFNVASVSKQFTAFAIGLLAQEGKLSLDDDIREYLPEMPDYGKRITLAHLVHHTSGVREHGRLVNLAGWRGSDPTTEADLMWALTRQRGLNFEPGTEQLYSNAGYTMLAVIVRRVSGQSLKDFTAERIFQPLGMKDTRFQENQSDLVPRRASGYSPRDGGGWRTHVPTSDHCGPSNLHTTAGDLVKWMENLVHGRVGGPALAEWMRTRATLNNGEQTSYGGGLRMSTYRGLRTVRHDGVDAGFRANVALFPDPRLTIVLLCNASTVLPIELTWKIAEVYLGEQMTASLPAVQVPAAELSALSGFYWHPTWDTVVQLELKDGALRRVDPSTVLTPLGDGAFRLGDTTETWRFTDSGEARVLEVTDPAYPRAVYRKLGDPVPTVPALAVFEGQYRSEDVDTTYTVRVTNGKLTVSWGRLISSPLDAIGGERFISGWLGTVTFTRDAKGKVNGMVVSNRRVRRLRAERLAPSRPSPAVSTSAPGRR